MKYSGEFSKQLFFGPYPEPHTIAGEKTPPDGDAQPASTVDGLLRYGRDAMPIGLSYADGQSFGPYIQHIGEGLHPAIEKIDFLLNKIPFSCGNVHPHTGLLLFSLALNQRPKIIIETGTFFGYSTFFLMKALEIWEEGKLYTIDINPEYISDEIKNSPYVEIVQETSITAIPRLVRELEEVQFVFLDTYKRQTIIEFILISGAIPAGGIVAMHDTQFLNTGKTTYEILCDLKRETTGEKLPYNELYDMMLFSGTPHKDNPHKFFGNADDRGLLVLRKRETDPFLEVADANTDTLGNKVWDDSYIDHK